MKYLVIATLLCLSNIGIAQTQNCSKFQNGKFKMVDSETGAYVIERKGNRQVEYSEINKLEMELDVKWIDECNYTLKVRKILSNPNNISVTRGMTVNVNITEVKENSYIQKVTSNMFTEVMENEVFLIQEDSSDK